MPTLGSTTPARGNRGFTLLEVMVTVAVLGIVAALALPSFFDSIRKGRRSEAITALGQVQQAQERWRANRSTYTKRLVDDLKLETRTPSGYYDLRIEDDADGSRYTATATAVAGKSQAGDHQCTVLRVRLVGGNLQYGGCAGCALPDVALTDPNRCWSR